MVPPVDHDEPRPPAGYVVSLVAFHERGLGVPAEEFLRRLLFRWDVEIQHLTPNGVMLVAAFVTLCEGWLGIEPNWNLFRELFFVKIQDKDKQPVPIGCAMIQFRPGMKAKFPRISPPSSIAEWREGWFYLRNPGDRPFPDFTGKVFTSGRMPWRESPDAHERGRVKEVVGQISQLASAGLSTAHLVACWLTKRVVPLRRRPLRFWELTQENSPWTGTVVSCALSEPEVRQKAKEISGSPVPRGSFPLPLPGGAAQIKAVVSILASLRFSVSAVFRRFLRSSLLCRLVTSSSRLPVLHSPAFFSSRRRRRRRSLRVRPKRGRRARRRAALFEGPGSKTTRRRGRPRAPSSPSSICWGSGSRRPWPLVSRPWLRGRRRWRGPGRGPRARTPRCSRARKPLPRGGPR
jgi:hypothetical protein